jgi:hypothetical protein
MALNASMAHHIGTLSSKKFSTSSSVQNIISEVKMLIRYEVTVLRLGFNNTTFIASSQYYEMFSTGRQSLSHNYPFATENHPFRGGFPLFSILFRPNGFVRLSERVLKF